MKNRYGILATGCLCMCILTACSGNHKNALPELHTQKDSVVSASQELSLKYDHVVLSQVGKTAEVYSGNIPVEKIQWHTEDDTVAVVERGVITVTGTGATKVYGEYDGLQVSCNVVCDVKDTQTNEPAEPVETRPSDPRAPVLAAPATQTVDAGFFDDAVFVGDSISLKLSYYAMDSAELGNAKFLVRASYGVWNEVNNAFHITYQGEEMPLPDALSAVGANKMFIMLGMNDIALYGVDATIANWGTMLDRIRQKNPQLQIYIQSMTPLWTGGERGALNNSNVELYNEKLKLFAEENGCKFIDVAPYMKDTTGGLATRFCMDQYVHLTDEGAKTWIKVLKAYTGY